MRIISKIKFVAHEHSPAIHFAVGVVGFFVTCVNVYKARPRFEVVLEEHNKAMADRKKAIEASKSSDGKIFYDKKDQRADLFAIWLKTVGGTIKAFWKSAISGFVSLWGFGKGYSILSGRLMGMTAACSALAADKTDIPVVADKEGEESESKEEATNYSELFPDGYICVFDKSNPNFEKDPANNRFFLMQKQNWFNQMLQARGYLYLNEVLKGIGLEPVEYGQVLGWVYYKETTKALAEGSSNFVDFGIFTNGSGVERVFVGGEEPTITLKLNIDKKPVIGRTALKKM